MRYNTEPPDSTVQWKRVEDSPRYWISEDGRVWNGEKYMKFKIDRYGYPVICLVKNGKKTHPTIHRLVALHFLEKREGRSQVNHIDGNKLNNHFSNLEWVNNRENIIHSYDVSLNPNSNHAVLRDLVSGQVYEFRSIKTMARVLGIHLSGLIPYIKRSNKYPVFNRYVITLTDPDTIDEKSNTENFGKRLFIKDGVTGKFRVCSSINAARYHTGFRAFYPTDKLRLQLGYYFSFTEELVKNAPNVENPHCVMLQREEFYSQPYSKMKGDTFVVKDELTGCERVYNQLIDVVEFLNRNIIHGVIDPSQVFLGLKVKSKFVAERFHVTKLFK